MITQLANHAERVVPRAEPVGSLLRSPEIVDAFNRLYRGTVCPCRSAVLPDRIDELRAVTEAVNRFVPSLVQGQLDAGLDVVTDGEMRRANFLSSFFDAVEGLEGGEDDLFMRFHPPVGAPLRKVASPLAEEAAYMSALGNFPFKVTLPAPSFFYMSDMAPLAPDSGYESRRHFVEAVAEIEQLLIAEAIAAGANWIQLDFPVYPALADTGYVAGLDARMPGDELLARAIEVDSAVVARVPDAVTIGLHLCRGNLPGGFWNGSLDHVAEQLFALPYHRFVVEWEDPDREGDFGALRYLPKGKVVALGLVSTKTPELEPEDELIGRIDDAARYADVNQLALSTQCGFATLYAYQLIDAHEAQWRKLELIGRVADRVWGSS